MPACRTWCITRVSGQQYAQQRTQQGPAFLPPPKAGLCRPYFGSISAAALEYERLTSRRDRWLQPGDRVGSNSFGVESYVEGRLFSVLVKDKEL